jgi:hypothetical protein
VSEKTSLVQSLLSLILEQPSRVWKFEELLDQLDWDAEDHRKLHMVMGRVAKRLCFENQKVLLHQEGRYWIARKVKADSVIAEKRLRKAVRAVQNKGDRFRAETEIFASQEIIPQSVIYTIRKQASKTARIAYS